MPTAPTTEQLMDLVQRQHRTIELLGQQISYLTIERAAQRAAVEVASEQQPQVQPTTEEEDEAEPDD